MKIRNSVVSYWNTRAIEDILQIGHERLMKDFHNDTQCLLTAINIWKEYSKEFTTYESLRKDNGKENTERRNCLNQLGCLITLFSDVCKTGIDMFYVVQFSRLITLDHCDKQRLVTEFEAANAQMNRLRNYAEYVRPELPPYLRERKGVGKIESSGRAPERDDLVEFATTLRTDNPRITWDEIADRWTELNPNDPVKGDAVRQACNRYKRRHSKADQPSKSKLGGRNGRT